MVLNPRQVAQIVILLALSAATLSKPCRLTPCRENISQWALVATKLRVRQTNDYFGRSAEDNEGVRLHWNYKKNMLKMKI